MRRFERIRDYERKKTLQGEASVQYVDGWLLCPECRKKLCKVSEDTKVRNLTLYCKRCKKEIPGISFGE